MDHQVSTYQRLVRSSIAENILSNAKIRINVNTIRPYLIGMENNKSSDVYKYMKNASQGNGFIQTSYQSKTITTARMFTRKNHLNLITLSDETVLSAIESRYKGGKIVVLDYKNYEPSIIGGIIGDVIPENLHTWALDLLPSVPRKVIKLYNMRLMYSIDFITMITKLSYNLINEFNCNKMAVFEYIEKFTSIREVINTYVESISVDFDKDKYILNSYGRKIYPKGEKNIFNNTIQSIGSDILVEAIIDLNQKIIGKDVNILFHRFDALYFDMSRDALFSHLGMVIKTMEHINDSIPLKVGIQIGDNLMSLKELDSG